MSTKFTDLEIKVLKNFSEINPSIVIEPDKIQVKSLASSIVGVYPFDEKYDFDAFGVYEINDLLSVLSALDKPEFEVIDKYLSIKSSNNDKVKYFTAAPELIPKVPNVETKFNKIDCELQFSLSSDKLAIINKMSSILKSKFLFFETDNKRIRITIGDELGTSCNNMEVMIEDGIKSNNLDTPVKISMVDFKILAGEYEVKISTKISKWTNLNNVVYYIFTSV